MKNIIFPGNLKSTKTRELEGLKPSPPVKKAIARPDLTKEVHKKKIEEERHKLAKKSKLPTDVFVAKRKQNAREKLLNKPRHF